jgi:pimeloyl-ACP methyl ester carboxylesterase
MPRVEVPLIHDDQSRTETVAVAYKVRGSGPVLVALIPGLMVPQSMYDALSDFLASSGRYTAVSIDNRGIGESDCPPASFLHSAASTGYTTSALARDAWAVIDHVRAAGRSGDGDAAGTFLPEIAVVGHSMGGMVAQRMILQRPLEVRFSALLSTHTGGCWNLVPTTSVTLSAIRVAMNRFDAKILAIANMDLHFTPHFLDQHVGPAPHIVHSLRKSSSRLWNAIASTQVRKHGHDIGAAVTAAIESGIVKRRRRRDIYFARYLGHDFDWVSDLDVPEDLLSPRIGNASGGSLLNGETNSPKREVKGAEGDRAHSYDMARAHAESELRRLIADKQGGKHGEVRARFKGLEPSTISSQAVGAKSPDPGSAEKSKDGSACILPAGHLSVVMSHSLSRSEASALSQCHRMHTVVIAGADDRVITPSASWALARAVGAAAYVEIPGAHFIFDERSAQVNHLIGLGLSVAFFPDNAAMAAYPDPCKCQWCKPVDGVPSEPAADRRSLWSRLRKLPSAIRRVVNECLTSWIQP